MYLQVIKSEKTFITDLINKYGTSFGLLLLLLLFIFVKIENNLFLFTASSNGLLIPIYSVIIWGIANNNDKIIKPLLSSKILNYLGKFSYQIYILQTVSYEISSKLNLNSYFLIILMILSFIVYYCIGVPSLKILMYFYKKMENGISSNLNNFVLLLYNNPYPWLAILKYYLAMSIIIISYIVVVGFSLEGSKQLLTLDAKKATGIFIIYIRWSVLIGLPAVVFAITV